MMNETMKNSLIFISPTYGRMTLEETCQSIFDYISSDSKFRYSIIIGTDSEGYGEVDFVTAVIVHRVGKGGRCFITKTRVPDIYVIKQKIYQEATLSIEITQVVVERLKQFINEDILFRELEIHVDIGRNGPTKDMIKEVVGMVKGSGYVVRIKPESFAASCVADRYTGQCRYTG